MEKLWNAMKRPNLQIINTGEEYCCEGITNICNKIKRESFHMERNSFLSRYKGLTQL